MKIKQTLLLIGIIILALGVRLYRITNPVADWHAFRQADTASVTREYLKHGINLLEPKYQDLSNIQSGLPNLEGWRMVEFPLLNATNALIDQALKIDPGSNAFVVESRLSSVFLSLGTLVCLYLLVKKLSDEPTALLAALTFAVLPYSVYYSRAILPEAGLLFFSTFSLLTFKLFVDVIRTKPQLNFSANKTWYYLFASALSLAVAFLLKPFVVFLAPVYLGLLLPVLIEQASERRFITLGMLTLTLLTFLGIVIFPIIKWRAWIQNFPSGIPASDWLMNGNGIRFRPAWFRWLFYERFTKLILGYVGVVFLLGLAAQFWMELKKFWTQFEWSQIKHFPATFVYALWWLGMLAYLAVFATGNVQHDYYQVILTPIMAISVAVGVKYLFNQLPRERWRWGVVTVLYSLMIFLGWQQVKGYFNVNHWEYVHAGQAVDKILPADAKVIAPAMGDTIFLFQTNRTGWPIGFEIDDKIEQGAEYYVTTSDDDEARYLQQQYPVLDRGEGYLILDLTKPIE